MPDVGPAIDGDAGERRRPPTGREQQLPPGRAVEPRELHVGKRKIGRQPQDEAMRDARRAARRGAPPRRSKRAGRQWLGLRAAALAACFLRLLHLGRDLARLGGEGGALGVIGLETVERLVGNPGTSPCSFPCRRSSRSRPPLRPPDLEQNTLGSSCLPLAALMSVVDRRHFGFAALRQLLQIVAAALRERRRRPGRAGERQRERRHRGGTHRHRTLIPPVCRRRAYRNSRHGATESKKAAKSGRRALRPRPAPA